MVLVLLMGILSQPLCSQSPFTHHANIIQFCVCVSHDTYILSYTQRAHNVVIT